MTPLDVNRTMAIIGDIFPDVLVNPRVAEHVGRKLLPIPIKSDQAEYALLELKCTSKWAVKLPQPIFDTLWRVAGPAKKAAPVDEERRAKEAADSLLADQYEAETLAWLDRTSDADLDKIRKAMRDKPDVGMRVGGKREPTMWERLANLDREQLRKRPFARCMVETFASHECQEAQ